MSYKNKLCCKGRVTSRTVPRIIKLLRDIHFSVLINDLLRKKLPQTAVSSLFIPVIPVVSIYAARVTRT